MLRLFTENWFLPLCNMETLQPDESTFRAAFSEKTRFVLINTPNNPTGAVYTPESLTMVASVMREMEEKYGHPIYLVSDEPYRKLAYGIEVPYLTHFYKNTIVVYSYSKALSIPGERIGYAAMEPLVDDFADLIAGLTASHALSGICERAFSSAENAAEMCGCICGYQYL